MMEPDISGEYVMKKRVLKQNHGLPALKRERLEREVENLEKIFCIEKRNQDKRYFQLWE